MSSLTPTPDVAPTGSEKMNQAQKVALFEVSVSATPATVDALLEAIPAQLDGEDMDLNRIMGFRVLALDSAGDDRAALTYGHDSSDMIGNVAAGDALEIPATKAHAYLYLAAAGAEDIVLEIYYV